MMLTVELCVWDLEEMKDFRKIQSADAGLAVIVMDRRHQPQSRSMNTDGLARTGLRKPSHLFVQQYERYS